MGVNENNGGNVSRMTITPSSSYVHWHTTQNQKSWTGNVCGQTIMSSYNGIVEYVQPTDPNDWLRWFPQWWRQWESESIYEKTKQQDYSNVLSTFTWNIQLSQLDSLYAKEGKVAEYDSSSWEMTEMQINVYSLHEMIPRWSEFSSSSSVSRSLPEAGEREECLQGT